MKYIEIAKNPELTKDLLSLHKLNFIFGIPN